eukprot:46891_1
MLSALRVLKKKLSIKWSQIVCNTECFIAVRTTHFKIYSTYPPQTRNTIKYQSQSCSSNTLQHRATRSNINRVSVNPSKSRLLITIPSRSITYRPHVNNVYASGMQFQNYHMGHDPSDKRHITVGVTGASGFVGSHCVQQLLMKGYTVHGTVRGNPSDSKYEWLYRLPSKGKLNLFQANLMQRNSFDEAVADCDYLFHVASQVNINVKDVQKEMVEPAVKGTMNVLDSCLYTTQSSNSKLKRVIMTSTTYALYGNPIPNYTYDEMDWNDDDTMETHAYAYGKTMAEQLAFEWIDAHRNKISFDLISVLPPLIIGAELNVGSKAISAGNMMIGTISRGLFTPINVMIPLVDVRDVAAAHLFFIENENGIYNDNHRNNWMDKYSGRFVIVGDCSSLPRLFEIMNQYSPIKLKRKDKIMIPKMYQRYAARHENVDVNISSDKIKLYGFQFRNMNDTIQNAQEYLFSRYKRSCNLINDEFI